VDELPECLEPPRAVERRRHPHLREAAIEARHVRFEAVGATVEDGQHLIGAVAEYEAAVERRDSRLLERQQAPVEPHQRKGHQANQDRIVSQILRKMLPRGTSATGCSAASATTFRR
jgi:hypothetical protein